MNDTTQIEKPKRQSIFGIEVNTILTGMTFLIMSLLGYINNQQNRANHDDTMAAVKDLKLEVVNSYVSKGDFQSQVANLTASDSKLWEKASTLSDLVNKDIGDINLKLQHIEDSIHK